MNKYKYINKRNSWQYIYFFLGPISIFLKLKLKQLQCSIFSKSLLVDGGKCRSANTTTTTTTKEYNFTTTHLCNSQDVSLIIPQHAWHIRNFRYHPCPWYYFQKYNLRTLGLHKITYYLQNSVEISCFLPVFDIIKIKIVANPRQQTLTSVIPSFVIPFEYMDNPRSERETLSFKRSQLWEIIVKDEFLIKLTRKVSLLWGEIICLVILEKAFWFHSYFE